MEESAMLRLFPWVFAFMIFLSICVSPIICEDDDASVMRSFSKLVSPLPKGWSSNFPCEGWLGVKCNSGGRISSIILQSKLQNGSLPENLGSLSSLEDLVLPNNGLGGKIPSFKGLTNLVNVDLDGNKFTSMDSAVFPVPSLVNFSIDDNMKMNNWVIPNELSKSHSLNLFSASNSNVVEAIPEFFGSLPSLKSIRLSYNKLSGGLPASFAGSPIEYLWINNQDDSAGLSGPITVIGSMDQLKQAWLHKNLFNGTIPDLSKCTFLFDLQLRDNQLTGFIPTSMLALPSLVTVSFGNNKLLGPYPSFNNSVTVADSATSKNNFCNSKPGPCNSLVTVLLEVEEGFGFPNKLVNSWTGNDPSGWLYLRFRNGELSQLNLDSQLSGGIISPAIANLSSLQVLILSDNNLTGSIPESLATLSQLQTIDVSNNNLTGKIPTFPASVKVITTGNPYLGANETKNNSSGSPTSISSTKSKALIIVLVVAFVLVAVIGVAIVCCRRWSKKSKHSQSPLNGVETMKLTVAGPSSNGGTSGQNSLGNSGHSDVQVFQSGSLVISIEDLRQGTNNFSSDNIVGRGGFGVVFKGVLSDGRLIAVKRMEASVVTSKGMSEFQAELAVLTKVRHRHLVALLGYCIYGNEKYLVYEYMPQGTLGEHLFDWREKCYQPLTWKQRLTVALDVARGIEYLHGLAQESFIHRDLKPSNILLGDDMRAKVSDFGLVKLAPAGISCVETRLAGTFGYLAPEYAATGRVTIKSDVYSFGVILMELITGRKVLDESQPEERTHLVPWFRRVLINKDNIRKIVDPTLEPDDETFDSILKVAELAGYCTAREPIQRPVMGHLVNALSPLVELWKPSSPREDEGSCDGPQRTLSQVLRRWQANEGTFAEGTSMMEGDTYRHLGNLDSTQTSIPSKPAGFADSFDSMDCR